MKNKKTVTVNARVYTQQKSELKPLIKKLILKNLSDREDSDADRE